MREISDIKPGYIYRAGCETIEGDLLEGKVDFMAVLLL